MLEMTTMRYMVPMHDTARQVYFLGGVLGMGNGPGIDGLDGILLGYTNDTPCITG